MRFSFHQFCSTSNNKEKILLHKFKLNKKINNFSGIKYFFYKKTILNK